MTGILVGLLFLATTAQAASFDCGKATSEIEKTICNDKELSELDESLSNAYRLALGRLNVRKKIIRSQRQWLKNERNACRNAECIKDAYQSRIVELEYFASFGIAVMRTKSQASKAAESPARIIRTPTGEKPESVNGSAEVVRDLEHLALIGQISTLAGRVGLSGSRNGPGTKARFDNPFGITTDGTNLYVTDTSNHTVRKIVIATGKVTTLAGLAGGQGSKDGVGRMARFRFPCGIATDGTSLYVADRSNFTIRKIVIATGEVTTLAGKPGIPGFGDGIGTAARFSYPYDLVIVGNNLYVTEHYEYTIRRIVIATGEVTTLAGTPRAWGFADGIGATAKFNMPEGITTDGSNLYVADSMNNTIRKIVIATGEVTTLAGPDNTACARDGWHGRCPSGSNDGVGSFARFNSPTSITADSANLYVIERHRAVRKIVIATGEATTLVEAPGVMGITGDGTSLYVTNVLGHTVIKIQ